MKLYKNKEYKTPDKNRTLIIRATSQDSIDGVEPPKGKKKPEKKNFYIVELRDYEEIPGDQRSRFHQPRLC